MESNGCPRGRGGSEEAARRSRLSLSVLGCFFLHLVVVSRPPEREVSEFSLSSRLPRESGRSGTRLGVVAPSHGEPAPSGSGARGLFTALPAEAGEGSVRYLCVKI